MQARTMNEDRVLRTKRKLEMSLQITSTKLSEHSGFTYAEASSLSTQETPSLKDQNHVRVVS